MRGQTARRAPQPAVDDLLRYRGDNPTMVPRHDGLLVQARGAHDFGTADTAVDRALPEAAVARRAGLLA